MIIPHPFPPPPNAI